MIKNILINYKYSRKVLGAKVIVSLRYAIKNCTNKEPKLSDILNRSKSISTDKVRESIKKSVIVPE